MRKFPLVLFRAHKNSPTSKGNGESIRSRFEKFTKANQSKVDRNINSVHYEPVSGNKDTQYTPYQKEKWHTLSHPKKSESTSLRSISIDDESFTENQSPSMENDDRKESGKMKKPKEYTENRFAKSPWKLQSIARKAQTQKLCEDVLWDNVVLKNSDSKVVRHLKCLKDQKFFRMERKKVVFHGYKVIMELARQQKIYPELLIYQDPSKTKNFNKRDEMIEVLRKEMEKNNDETFFVQATRSVMKEIDKDHDGFIAEYQMPECSPKELLFASPHQFQNILVLDNITDGGHLGTMMRTAVSFGYELVVFVNNCADIFDSTVLRAARGAHFQQNTHFVSLCDADGDDETELLNRTLEHHQAVPFVYSPKIGKDTKMPCVSLESAQRNVIDTAISKKRSQNLPENQAALGNPSFQNVSCAIFVSDDATSSFVPKLESRLRSLPKRILIDEYEDQHGYLSQDSGCPEMMRQDVPHHSSVTTTYKTLDVALPIILHSMRAAEVSSAATQEEQDMLAQKPTEDYIKYTRKVEENIVGDENIRTYFDEVNRSRYDRRMERYQMSDEERWESLELNRIRQDHKNFRRFMTDIFDDKTPQILDGDNPYPSQNDRTSLSTDVYPNLFQDRQKLMKPSRDSIRMHSVLHRERRFPSKFKK